jgi:hypothetical protein
MTEVLIQYALQRPQKDFWKTYVLKLPTHFGIGLPGGNLAAHI